MTEEEWVGWKNYESTQKMFKRWEEMIQLLKNEWAKGNFTRIEGNDAFNRGYIAGLNHAMEPISEKVEEEDEE